MNAEEILFYLEKLSDVLAKHDTRGEIVLYGGAVMVIAFHARPATKDVDAVFVPKEQIYLAAREVEELYGAPEHWLNDAVKGFISPREELVPFINWPNLKVYAASPHYLLAMKCMSMRLGRGESDLKDIRFLIEHLNIKTREDVLDLLVKYYPKKLISPKVQFAMEELFEQMAVNQEGNIP